MSDEPSRIHFLPNLMTAGNLVSGFAATLTLLHGTPLTRADPARPSELFSWVAGFILAACMFDFLDGLLARLCRQQNAFGREFDSLADLVSFGVAPALLAYRVVLHDFPRSGWIVASIYVLCGAMRLARFNSVAATRPVTDGGKNFDGLPIPAAAGLVASLSGCLIWLSADAQYTGDWKWVLPPLMLFISFMMVSRFRYPSLKALNLRTPHRTLKVVGVALLLVITGLNLRWMPATLLLGYLAYGFLHPIFSIGQPRQTERTTPTIDQTMPAPPQARRTRRLR